MSLPSRYVHGIATHIRFWQSKLYSFMLLAIKRFFRDVAVLLVLWTLFCVAKFLFLFLQWVPFRIVLLVTGQASAVTEYDNFFRELDRAISEVSQLQWYFYDLAKLLGALGFCFVQVAKVMHDESKARTRLCRNMQSLGNGPKRIIHEFVANSGRQSRWIQLSLRWRHVAFLAASACVAVPVVMAYSLSQGLVVRQRVIALAASFESSLLTAEIHAWLERDPYASLPSLIALMRDKRSEAEQRLIASTHWRVLRLEREMFGVTQAWCQNLCVLGSLSPLALAGAAVSSIILTASVSEEPRVASDADKHHAE